MKCDHNAYLADFNIEEFQLTFSPSQSPQTRCTNVMSVADNRLEGNEVFSLTLVTSEFSVIIEPTAVTSITVQDDTGESHVIVFMGNMVQIIIILYRFSSELGTAKLYCHGRSNCYHMCCY